MTSCARGHELLCLSSPYSHCQSRRPCVTHGLATQDCPISASQHWAILRLQELTLTLTSLPHSGLATYIVCSTSELTFTASVQREGNKCFSGPERISPERHTSYISTSPRNVRDQAVTSMGQRDRVIDLPRDCRKELVSS